MHITKKIFILFTCSLLLTQMSFGQQSMDTSWDDPSFDHYANNFYKGLKADDLNFQAFRQALSAYHQLDDDAKLTNDRYLTLIDMSKTSKKKRFFLIDLQTQELVHSSVVAHGKNSGVEFANRFSNIVNSHQTGLGFYRTAETYYGKHGYSLRLDGLESSNSNARKRAIVIHSAKYANPEFIEQYGRLGRSFGCPSLPEENYTQVIEKIKEGSLLYIYYPDKSYVQSSELIQGTTKWLGSE